ncbi:MAG: type II secretion system protein [candidate division WOR-3 bacterium]
MRPSDYTTKPGLTLIELLVAMTIFSIILTLTLLVFLNLRKAQTQLDKKYEISNEVERLCKEIENALKFCQKLISCGQTYITFIDINGDTIEYHQNNDTLYKNNKIFTNLTIDSLSFIFVRLKEKEEIKDFYLIDENRDGILTGGELKNISGIAIYLLVSYPEGFKRIKIRKNFFIAFRNL